jgi:hypothetical protein
MVDIHFLQGREIPEILTTFYRKFTGVGQKWLVRTAHATTGGRIRRV